jgi:hypothetical protein
MARNGGERRLLLVVLEPMRLGNESRFGLLFGVGGAVRPGELEHTSQYRTLNERTRRRDYQPRDPLITRAGSMKMARSSPSTPSTASPTIRNGISRSQMIG